MPDESRLIGAFGLSLVAVALATPLAVLAAERLRFHDHPVGYKGHLAPTPYLGGAALVAGFLLGVVAFGEGVSRFAPIAAATAFLWLVGTADDRLNLRPSLRVLAELGSATLLWAFDLGWSVFSSDVANLIVTNLWVVAVVNAFAIMDNMDGAASTVGAVAAMGAGALAVIGGDVVLGAVALALSGACAGFLPFNLWASPARIFLGDGGSIPLGFVVGSAIMTAPMADDVGWSALLVAVLLVGVPALDAALVVVSRLRRGVPLATGGRDHLTHRLLQRLGSARAVALALGLAQASLCALAVSVTELGRMPVVTASVVCLVAGVLVVSRLETPAWAPPRRESSV